MLPRFDYRKYLLGGLIIAMGFLVNLAFPSRGRSEPVTFPLLLVHMEMILMYFSCQEGGSR